jgi:hypothetical protein
MNRNWSYLPSAPGRKVVTPGVIPPGPAVEKARNRSPEKWEPAVPVRARPGVTRSGEPRDPCRRPPAGVRAGRKNDTAQELWIQRRTLYGRLARIERLLGRRLSDQDTRTRLTLALQGLGLLQQRQSAVPIR